MVAEHVPWQARNARFRQERNALLQQREQAGASTRTPLHPDRVYAELRQVAPPDALFTLDAGTTGLQATDQLPYRTVPALLTPLDCGMIGFRTLPASESGSPCKAHGDFAHGDGVLA
jgi:acetolactate synthase-1/2/3 large subunit/sulfoacetaldehyde acetyltransferase